MLVASVAKQHLCWSGTGLVSLRAEFGQPEGRVGQPGDRVALPGDRVAQPGDRVAQPEDRVAQPEDDSFVYACWLHASCFGNLCIKVLDCLSARHQIIEVSICHPEIIRSALSIDWTAKQLQR